MTSHVEAGLDSFGDRSTIDRRDRIALFLLSKLERGEDFHRPRGKRHVSVVDELLSAASEVTVDYYHTPGLRIRSQVKITPADELAPLPMPHITASVERQKARDREWESWDVICPRSFDNQLPEGQNSLDASFVTNTLLIAKLVQLRDNSF